MKKALITGVSGFAGSFLAEYLIEKNAYSIVGTYLSESSKEYVASLGSQLSLTQVDLMDREKVSELIKKERPDVVFHLAALSSPAESFKDPSRTINNNIVGEVNLLEAIREAELMQTRILIISSAEVYGVVSQDDLPVDEETNLRPASPYAVSKIAQDFLGLQYYYAHKLPIIRVRPFNHIGPRQTPNFVVSSFAKQIAEIEKKKNPPVLHVGNLSAKRDFTDVRDIVYAYDLLIEKGIAGDVYNLGTGKSYRISDVLQTLLSLSSITITVTEDQALFRPGDLSDNVCDRTKITKVTGWEPKISLEKSLHDTLDYWRNII